ncbi:MAG: YtxH domain-containing protein [Nitrospirae bacterium]|nr:YtxH domain-containing protein [Nitrospirota bacterium]
MSDNHGASAGSVALAFLSGILLGAVTAFLMAPQTGRESRDGLLRAARRAGDDFKDISEKATHTWDDVVGKSREFMSEASSVVKDAVDAGKEAMRPVRDSYRDETNSKP